MKKLVIYSIFSCLTLGTIALLAGVKTSDSLFVGLVIAAQMLSGIIFWILISKKKSFTFPELFGLGIAFGSLFSLLTVYFFRQSSFREIAWLIPCVVIICYSLSPVPRCKISDFEIQELSRRDLAFIFSATIFALSLLWIWALPLAFLPLGVTLWKTRYQQIFVIFFALTATVVSQILRSSNSSWWIFSHDQMYLEGFGEGLFRYGQHENMHLVGYGFPYHWFSLLWSTTVSHAAHLDPLVGLGIVLPIVAIFACINLLWALTYQHSRSAAFIAVIAFVLGSNAINWTPIRFTNSPTFLFSLIWLLAFVYILQDALTQNRFGLDLVLGALLFGAFGGKVTHGIIIMSGLGALLLARIFQSRRLSSISGFVRLYGVLSIATIAIYLFAYRGQEVGGRMLYVSPGELGFQVGVAYMSSSQWIWVIATIAILIGCSSMFLLGLSISIGDPNRDINIFCAGSFLGSLLLTLILAQEGGSQGYFLLSALVLILIPASKAIARLDKPKLGVGTIFMLLISFIFCFCAVRFWDSTPADFDPYRFGLIFKICVFTFPFFTFLLIRWLLNREFKALGFNLLFSIFLLFGISHRISAIEAYFNNFSIDKKIEPISGSEKRKEALTWLEQNSNENDLVATNRFCIPNVDPCNKKWYLVSAISRRRLLIEGFGYGLPLGKGVSVASERMINSMEFGRKPNRHLWEYLKSFNVQWFVVDSAAGRVTDTWEPFATVVYQNSEMKILKVSNQL